MGQNQTKLTAEDFKDILEGTKFSKDEVNDWFSKFKSQFPRGKIHRYEFLVMYKKLFPDGDAGEFTDNIFRTYDENGDGVINFREFLTTVSIAQRGTAEEKFKWAFRLYDMDGNGELTLEEITSVLTSIYKARRQRDPEKKAKQSANDFLFKLDKNNDGVITEEEFITGINSCPSLKELLTGY